MLSSRTRPSSKRRRSLWPRPSEEVDPARQDGEERDAQPRAGRQGAYGSRCTYPSWIGISWLLQTNSMWQQQLSLWGEAGDEDVSDVTDKLGVLLYEIGDLEDQYVDRYDQYRVTMKSIRNIEASVQPSRDRKFRRND